MSKADSLSYISSAYTRLELVDLVLAVSKLLQVAVKLALVRRALLATTDRLVHGWWAANEDLDLLTLLGLGENGLQELLGDVTFAALPLLWWVVEDVEGPAAWLARPHTSIPDVAFYLNL